MKNALLFIIIAVLMILVGLIPGATEGLLNEWGLKYLGDSYQLYLICFFVIAALLLAYLTSDSWRGKGDTLQVKRSTSYNIPKTAANLLLLQQAKEAIRQAHLVDALQLLSQINTPSEFEDVNLLSARLAEHEREKRQGILSHDEIVRTLNTLSKDTLALVVALESELKTGADYQKTIKAYLLNRYKKRLDSKLASRHPINLRLLPTTEGTSKETGRTFEPFSKEALKGHIAEVFQAAYGRLLITGVPGAGKTSVLLELAVGLLEKEMDGLPVLLNLATWKKEYTTLETWLKEILPAEMGIGKRLAADILQQDQLILLFDALDEVKDEDRISCLEAIARYGATAHRQFVLTSRIEEYKAVAKDASVYQQIEVGVLTLTQMKTELQRLWEDKKQPEAKPLLQAIQQDAELRKAIEIPFYFNALQLLFGGGKRVSDLHLESGTAAERQATITEQFVTYALESISGKSYTPEQAKRYLSFLAFNMTKKNKVVFELADLQYDWYGGKWSKWELFVAGLIFGLVTCFVFGLVFGTVAGLFGGLVFGFVFGTVVGLFGGLVAGFFGGLRYQRMLYVETRAHIKWFLFLYLKSAKIWVVKIFVRGFVKIFVVGLFLGLAYGLLLSSDYGLVYGLVYGFVFVLVVSLIGVLVIGLIAGLDDYIKNYNTAIMQINKPYERFSASVKVLHFSILQHYHLLHVLSKRGLLPFKIVPFLNAMTAQHILESDGATWRFRHRILQEYFERFYPEPEILDKEQ